MFKKLKSKIKKLREKIKKFFDNEKVNDFFNTIKFVLIHGTLGLFLVLCIISIIGLDFIIVERIRNSITLTIVTFLIGSGSGYYILMDISDFYNNMRKINRR